MDKNQDRISGPGRTKYRHQADMGQAVCLTFRAKEKFSERENFLTEGFAYFLQRNKKVCEAFVKKVLGNHLEVEPDYKVTTRLVEPTPTGNCFPDLKLEFRASKVRYTFLSEHKWDSEIRQNQLVCYEEVLKSLPADEKRLITIVAHPEQKRVAKVTPLSMPTTHLLWEDVYKILERADAGDSLLVEFVDFMKAKNLNPGPPIQAATMRAFLVSISFKPQLMRYSDKLLNEYDWSIIPKPYDSIREVNDRWGRVALQKCRAISNCRARFFV